MYCNATPAIRQRYGPEASSGGVIDVGPTGPAAACSGTCLSDGLTALHKDNYSRVLPCFPGQYRARGGRGVAALDVRVVRHVLLSWLATTPVAAGLAIGFFYAFCNWLG